MIILHVHMREIGYCNKGGRLFCAKHNLDWQKFIREGVDESVLISTGDAMALRIVESARGKK